MKKAFPFLLASAAAMASCKKDKADDAGITVYKAGGTIEATVNAFRSVLGAVNTTPGAATGRREINWDGVPDSLLNKPLPADFFNPVGANAVAARQRGLKYRNGDFQVSATGFAHINANTATEFRAFSGDKVFANVSAGVWPVEFEVAGKTTPAGVKAFGMVFNDVDTEGAATLELFEGTTSLGTFPVPAHDGITPFSFLGVQVANRTITKVMVRHQGILNAGAKDVSQGGPADLIVLDDMIYSEPLEQSN